MLTDRPAIIDQYRCHYYCVCRSRVVMPKVTFTTCQIDLMFGRGIFCSGPSCLLKWVRDLAGLS